MRFLSMANSSRNTTPPPDRNFVNALSTPPEKRTNQVCVRRLDLIGLISRGGQNTHKINENPSLTAVYIHVLIGAAAKSALSKIGVTCLVSSDKSDAKKVLNEWKSDDAEKGRQIKSGLVSGAATHPGRSTKVASASRLCLARPLQTRSLRKTWGKRRPLLVSYFLIISKHKPTYKSAKRHTSSQIHNIVEV